jgi:hypothetical protein
MRKNDEHYEAHGVQSRPIMPLSRQLLTFVPVSLLLSGGIGLMAACASGELSEPVSSENRDWTCERANVPMGEVLRCTSGSSSQETPSQAANGAGGGDSIGIRTVGTPVSKKPDCGPDVFTTPPDPPATPPSPPSSDPPPPPPPNNYPCTSGSSPNCPPTDVPPTPPPAPGNESPGPDECAENSSLPYCGGPPAPPPAPPPPGEPWNCTESNGKKTCDGPPSCAAGTHPSKCGACVVNGESDDCAPPSQGGCWVTGGGFLTANNKDNFGGNAKQMKDGSIQGHWNHEAHAKKDHLKGKPSYIFCRHVDEPGPGQPGGKKGFDMNQIYFGGPAEYRADKEWASGYWFDVVAKDHGEPGAGKAKGGENVDTYHLTIRKMVDTEKQISGAIVYEIAGNLSGGNIQIHPPNNGHPGFQSELPKWVSLEP